LYKIHAIALGTCFDMPKSSYSWVKYQGIIQHFWLAQSMK